MARILIIDDDPDIVESTKIVLESEDFEVDTASSGSEGMKKAKLNKPDLIILDVMMETGDKGFDVARNLRKESGYENIPILMITSLKEKTGIDFKKEAGDETWLPVSDYCDKPLRPDELIFKVKNLLTKKR